MSTATANARSVGAGKRLRYAPLRIRCFAEVSGSVLTDLFHLFGLFAIGAATVWSAVIAYIHMFAKGSASVEDLLLLFIYLEIGAMVGIYFKTNRLPVRFLIYVAMTALTRHLIGVINVPIDHNASSPKALELNTLVLTGAITLLASAVLVLRYGSHQFPSEPIAAYETDLKANASEK
ncbi:MAG: phosphate-starvation-inducible PsiE family protein [Hyphomicrobiaceae bacterium]